MKLDLLLNLYLFLISTNSHLGSKSRPLLSKRAIHPKATAALLGKKQGLPYINPLETLKGLVHSLRVIRFVVENGGSVLVVNTNPALSPVINKLVLINSLEGAKRGRKGKISFCNERWIGGLLSNWSQLSKSVLVFRRFFQQFDSLLFENNINLSVYTEMKKKFSGLIPLEPEQLINNFFFLKRKQRSIKREMSNQSSVGGEKKPLSGVRLRLRPQEDKNGDNHFVCSKTGEGVKSKRDLNSSSSLLSLERAKKHNLVQKLRASEREKRKLLTSVSPFGKDERSTPTILFLIDPNQNQHVLQETNQLKIPTIAITNSNTDQSGVQYSIPGNMNSIHFVYYCLKCVVSVVNQRGSNLTGEM